MKVYRKLSKKEAAVPGIGKAIGAMGLVGNAAHLALLSAIALPVAGGALLGHNLSKMSDPTPSDFENIEDEVYMGELRARLKRMKALKAAQYEDVKDRTLRI